MALKTQGLLVHTGRPVWRPDVSGRSLQSYIGLYHFDLMLNSNSSASGHSIEQESGHLGNSARAWPEYRTRPVSISNASGHVKNTTA